MKALTIALLFAVLAVPVLALAQDAGPSDQSPATSPGEQAPDIFDDDLLGGARAAWSAGGWLALLGFAVSIGVRVGRPFAARHVDWFSTTIGGYAFTFAAALAASIGAALSVGAPISASLIGTAVAAAMASVGLTPGQDARSPARPKQ